MEEEKDQLIRRVDRLKKKVSICSLNRLDPPLKGLSTQLPKICLRNAHQTSQTNQFLLLGTD